MIILRQIWILYITASVMTGYKFESQEMFS